MIEFIFQVQHKLTSGLSTMICSLGSSNINRIHSWFLEGKTGEGSHVNSRTPAISPRNLIQLGLELSLGFSCGVNKLSFSCGLFAGVQLNLLNKEALDWVSSCSCSRNIGTESSPHGAGCHSQRKHFVFGLNYKA